MKFKNPNASIFVPDSKTSPECLSRTNLLCIAAHADDVEIMAYHPISNCYSRSDRWFSSVTVTDGAGTPRSGLYSEYTDAEMIAIRSMEQRKAAVIGEYAACIQLNYSSDIVKDASNDSLICELSDIIAIMQPETIYTHNLADKHDTHVAVVLRTIAACRSLPPEHRPKKLISCEVWRGLDWLSDSEKVLMDTSLHPNLAVSLVGVYDSQISGGKRYDLAAVSRRVANATFFESHEIDTSDSMNFGMDLSPLLTNSQNPLDFIKEHINTFMQEVSQRIKLM